jgi:hypothetical protein
MDAADASLVVLSELFPKAKVITTDRWDFTVCRRFKRQKTPAVFPSDS